MRRRCAWEEPQGSGTCIEVKRGVGTEARSSGNMIRILKSEQGLKEGSAHSGIVIQDLLPHISVTDHARDCNHASQLANTLDAFRDLDPDGAECVV